MKWSEHPNAKRWLKPPTIEQIDAVVKASGTSELQFERFYNIYPGCIKNIRLNPSRRMPVQFWDLFLEDKKVPNSVSNLVSPSVRKPVSTLKSTKPKQPKPSADSRLNKLV